MEIRRLRREDGDQLRDIRLRALAEAPYAFSSSLEREQDAVAGWARDVGAERLRLAVIDCDAARPAATLYHRLGFVDTGEREPLEWNPALITRILARPT